LGEAKDSGQDCRHQDCSRRVHFTIEYYTQASKEKYGVRERIIPEWNREWRGGELSAGFAIPSASGMIGGATGESLAVRQDSEDWYEQRWE